MPDILKITTPVLSKVDPTGSKQLHGPAAAVGFQELQRVVKATPQGELLKQNNSMLQQEDAPVILLNMLKDPSVTVSFLKNIFLLEEIIQLLPVNNRTVTRELEQMFQALLVRPEEVVEELARQEQKSTRFRGGLFGFLREFLAQSPDDPDRRGAVATLLKAVSSGMSNRDVLDALANSLQFMSESLSSSRKLSSKLLDLCRQFRGDEAENGFEQLKHQTLAALKEVEESILYSSRLEKVASIVRYNLSRYNGNPEFLQDAVMNLAALLNRQQRHTLHTQLTEFLDSRNSGRTAENSAVMDALTRMIDRGTEEESVHLAGGEQIEKILHGLLSSPCNFTPLLHYVVPVQNQDQRAFAEIWINPNGQDDDKKAKEGEKCCHVLIVFDIEGTGRFEAELFLREKRLDLSLFCPPFCASEIGRRMRERLPACMEAAGLQLGTVRMEELEKTRSLMDVFKFLPYKRMGVNVKI